MGRDDVHGRSPFGELVGRKILHVDADRGILEVEYLAGPDFTNRIGTVAGGMVAALLDSVTGLVANAGLPDGLVAVHTSLRVEYHRPVPPGPLTGRSRVVDRAERDVRSQGELLDGAGNRLASAEATLRVIRRPAESTRAAPFS